MIAKVTPSFTATTDFKRFFATVNAGTEDESKVPIRFGRNVVVVTTAYGDKVAFAKTTRGKSYADSRSPRKNIDEAEVKSELLRLLDCPHKAADAFRALTF